MKEIVIDVSDDGEVRIETAGFQGHSCLEESQFLKDLLGKQTYSQLTPAFYTRRKIKITKYQPLCG